MHMQKNDNHILDLLACENNELFLRYFKDKTQVQVAKILGISQVHVSRLEKKAIKELKNSSNSTATIFISNLMLIVAPSFLAEFHLIAVC